MAYCHRCDRYFKNEAALDQHRADSSNHWMCYDCDRDFASHNARRQHYINNPRHHYCGRCDEDFDDHDDLEDHYDEYHFYCRDCEEFFDSLEEEDDHKEEEHWFCLECRRMFNNESNLKHHLRTHLPKKVRCPGRGCERSFTMPADLVHHFESGTCRSGVTRAAIDRAVVAYDRRRVITDPARLITGPDGQYAPDEPDAQWATSGSWNGTAFECVLCHRTFRQLFSLNAHLASPAHATQLYRCPAAYGGCDSRFRTLSALVQHVEVESCGVSKFRKHVRDVMGELGRGLRGLTL